MALVCGVAAAIGVIVAISGGASAQPTFVNCPPIPSGTAANNSCNNPPVAKCGLKVMLMLDESQSIDGFGATGDVRQAAVAFVHGFEGTDSPVALAAFNSIARRGFPTTGTGYVPITASNVNSFTSWINRTGTFSTTGYLPPATVTASNPTATGGSGQTNIPAGTTNWEDGLAQAFPGSRDPAAPPTNSRVGTPDGPPDLLVFVTDGDPNTVNNPGRLGNQGLASNANRFVSGRWFISHDEPGYAVGANAAVREANRLKARGTKIFAIGVGPDIVNHGAASRERLIRISGTREGASPIQSDFTIVRNFPGLKDELLHLALTLCGPHSFTGYVDGFRSTPAHAFPDPWEGRVYAFLGCNYFGLDRCPRNAAGADVYDSGALRIHHAEDNPGRFTVTHASVTIGLPGHPPQCTYDPWGSNLHQLVPRGRDVILTQTGGPSPCDGDGVNGPYNFDTSESNHSDTPCVDNGFVPEVHFTFNINGLRDAHLTFRDTRRLLNHHGINPSKCPDLNESTNWAEDALQGGSNGRNALRRPHPPLRGKTPWA